MINNYKVVCLTPAGRRRYIQYLIPQVLSSDVVDRYDIWLNTNDKLDIEFIRKVARLSGKIRIVDQPDGKVTGNRSINAFFRNATDPDTIYVRLDDDIIWIEPGFFEKIVQFRIENPQFFVVSPLVINNALCTHILQSEDKFYYPDYITASCFDKNGWKDGKFALKLHTWFVSKVKNKSYSNIKCGIRPIALNRFSINAICWFGAAFKEFNGIVLDDEEEYLSVKKPGQTGKMNCFYCDTIVSHFAFYTQRVFLDKSGILSNYQEIINMTYSDNEEFNRISNGIKDINNTYPSRDIMYSFKSKRKYIRSVIAGYRIPVIRLMSVREIINSPPRNKSVKNIK